MDNISLDKQRFIETGEGLEVTLPQCVGCRFNSGAESCDALASKVPEFVSNEQKCPMFEAE